MPQISLSLVSLIGSITTTGAFSFDSSEGNFTGKISFEGNHANASGGKGIFEDIIYSSSNTNVNHGFQKHERG